LSDLPRLLLLANRTIPQVSTTLKEFRPWLDERAQVVAEPQIDQLSRLTAANLPSADLAVVFGGDGTLLAQARHLVDLEIPLVGINFGKLGFLAEFSLEDLKQHWDKVVSGQCRTSRRVMIEASVINESGEKSGDSEQDVEYTSVAMNDVVITAGPPFRMIELELGIDPQRWASSGTILSCDGVIVGTPSGSTAYNLAAGGPIVSPELDAFCVTPICPHSLAFRPIVISSESKIRILILRANEGTTLVIDGQESIKLRPGQTIAIRRYEKSVRLIQNPQLNPWKVLAKKMRWAARPRRN
jgi:NAD+ kinase